MNKIVKVNLKMFLFNNLKTGMLADFEIPKLFNVKSSLLQ